MGILLPSNPLEEFASPLSSSQLKGLVASVLNLSPTDQSSFLSEMFSGMSMAAKEAAVQVMWETLNLRERALFELPRDGTGPRSGRDRDRWTQAEILRGLSTPALRSRRPEFGNFEATSSGMSVLPRGLSTFTATNAIFNHADGRMTTGNALIAQEPRFERQREESERRTSNARREMEDQIFEILAQAITRAERTTAITGFGTNRGRLSSDDME
ncbi:hypothetical protein HDV05_007106 [Chytridiales sp. JEL 0842]|nr:hypothetical protein HDV05_007106 [Chytridiales sp. JEL 0842]